MTDAKKANPMVDFSFVMIKKLTTKTQLLDQFTVTVNVVVF